MIYLHVNLDPPSNPSPSCRNVILARHLPFRPPTIQASFHQTSARTLPDERREIKSIVARPSLMESIQWATGDGGFMVGRLTKRIEIFLLSFLPCYNYFGQRNCYFFDRSCYLSWNLIMINIITI